MGNENFGISFWKSKTAISKGKKTRNFIIFLLAILCLGLLCQIGLHECKSLKSDSVNTDTTKFKSEIELLEIEITKLENTLKGVRVENERKQDVIDSISKLKVEYTRVEGFKIPPYKNINKYVSDLETKLTEYSLQPNERTQKAISDYLSGSCIFDDAQKDIKNIKRRNIFRYIANQKFKISIQTKKYYQVRNHLKYEKNNTSNFYVGSNQTEENDGVYFYEISFTY